MSYRTSNKYKRLRKPKEKAAEDEMRIKADGSAGSYISYAAHKLCEQPPVEGEKVEEIKEKENKPELLKTLRIMASGTAISKACVVTEILRQRIKGLHVQYSIKSQEIVDHFEPTEKGLDAIEEKRVITVLEVIVSTVDIEHKTEGYNAPLKDEEIVPFPHNFGRPAGLEGKVNRRNEGHGYGGQSHRGERRGFGGGRGRRGGRRGGPRQYNEKRQHNDDDRSRSQEQRSPLSPGSGTRQYRGGRGNNRGGRGQRRGGNQNQRNYYNDDRQYHDRDNRQYNNRDNRDQRQYHNKDNRDDRQHNNNRRNDDYYYEDRNDGYNHNRGGNKYHNDDHYGHQNQRGNRYNNNHYYQEKPQSAGKRPQSPGQKK